MLYREKSKLEPQSVIPDLHNRVLSFRPLMSTHLFIYLFRCVSRSCRGECEIKRAKYRQLQSHLRRE